MDPSRATRTEYTYRRASTVLGMLVPLILLAGFLVVWTVGWTRQEAAAGRNPTGGLLVTIPFWAVAGYFCRQLVAYLNEKVVITTREIAWFDALGRERLRSPLSSVRSIGFVTRRNRNQSVTIATVSTDSGSFKFTSAIDGFSELSAKIDELTRNRAQPADVSPANRGFERSAVYRAGTGRELVMAAVFAGAGILGAVLFTVMSQASGLYLALALTMQLGMCGGLCALMLMAHRNARVEVSTEGVTQYGLSSAVKARLSLLSAITVERSFDSTGRHVRLVGEGGTINLSAYPDPEQVVRHVLALSEARSGRSPEAASGRRPS